MRSIQRYLYHLRSAAGVCTLAVVASCGSSPVDPNDDPNNQTIPTTCEPSNTVELVVGESVEYRGNAAALICMQATAAHASYVLIATSTATSGTAQTNLLFAGTATTAAITPPAPIAPEGAPIAAAIAAERLVEDFGFHIRVREEAVEELNEGNRVPGAVSAPPAFAPSAAPPTLGELLVLNAQSATGQRCTNPINVVGRVMVVSNKAIVVADTLNPAGGFSTADYEAFASFFDTQITPLTDEYFGAVTDIDGNGRTILLFTREVNRLTSSGSSSYVGGFFHPRDLESRADCSTSNFGEILYLLVPDPTGSINGNVRSLSFVQGITRSTMVHEQQHLINAARRRNVLQLTGNSVNEETWLNEGLSHLAEELLFYRMSLREPEANLSLTQIQNTGRVGEFNAYQAANFQRFREYLVNPSASAPYHSGDALATRGASWSFLRYVVDRQNAAHAHFLRGLVTSPSRGLTNLSQAIGGNDTLSQWLVDWGVAVYADDRVTAPATSDRHRLRSWNFPSFVGALPSTSTLGADCIPVLQTGYPICTRSLPAGTSHNVSIVRGGSAYFRFGVDAGTIGRVKITPSGGGLAPPGTMVVTVLRTR